MGFSGLAHLPAAIKAALKAASTVLRGDVSEEQRLQAELHRVRTQYLDQAMHLKVLLENVPLPLFFKDSECRYLGCNTAFEEFFGASRDALIGRSVYEIAPSENARKYDEADRELMTRRGRQSYEWNVRRADGEDRRVIFHKATFLRGDDTVGGIVGAVVDITERQKLEKEWLRSNSELEQFAYIVSHDLRQPLRMISSYMTLIERRLKPHLAGELLEFFAFAKNGARQMDNLILSLLDYSRIGRRDEFAMVALQDVIADARLNLEPLIAETGAVLTIADDLPSILGDRLELMRLFQNLIGNALKFRAADRSCRISVNCRSDGAHWLLSIRDNGIGIAPDYHERIFGLFQRLGGDKYEGTGIGLALCRKIVEHHGGRIWVESAPDQGATLMLTLPKDQGGAA